MIFIFHCRTSRWRAIGAALRQYQAKQNDRSKDSYSRRNYEI